MLCNSGERMLEANGIDLPQVRADPSTCGTWSLYPSVNGTPVNWTFGMALGAERNFIPSIFHPGAAATGIGGWAFRVPLWVTRADVFGILLPS